MRGDAIAYGICKAVDAVGEFAEKHPLFVLVLVILAFFGGCSIGVHLHIVSSSTKLMPY